MFLRKNENWSNAIFYLISIKRTIKLTTYFMFQFFIIIISLNNTQIIFNLYILLEWLKLIFNFFKFQVHFLYFYLRSQTRFKCLHVYNLEHINGCFYGCLDKALIQVHIIDKTYKRVHTIHFVETLCNFFPLSYNCVYQ